MITLPPLSSEENGIEPSSILFLGVGNAGVHLIDQLAMSRKAPGVLAVTNTDSQSLMSSIAVEKLQLGEECARGLGTGGDPEQGVRAAEESLSSIEGLLENRSLVFLCTGLGGGTGSGASTVIARKVKEAKAFLITLATLPFSFEGKRRERQAEEALLELERHSDVLLTFENDRMSAQTRPGAGIADTFATADETLVRCLTSLCGMLFGGGLLRVGLDDLRQFMRGRNPRVLFGQGMASGGNRCHDAVEQALKAPLLGRGTLLAESHAVIIHLAVPPAFTFAELNAAVSAIQKHTEDDCQIKLGLTVGEQPGDNVQVSVLACIAEEVPVVSTSPVRNSRADARVEDAGNLVEDTPPQSPSIPEPANLFQNEEELKKPSEPVPATPPQELVQPSVKRQPELVQTPPLRPPRPAPRAARERKTVEKEKQQTLEFESITRGRFEKSEPTIIEGEDLDVPTFLRHKMKVKP